MNRILRIESQDFLRRVPWYFTPFGSRDGSESCEAQPNCGTVFHSYSTFVFAFSVLRVESSFDRLLTRLFFNLAGTDSCPLLCIPIQFYNIDIREDANVHKGTSCKYLSDSICTVVEEFCQSDFCL